MATKAIQGLRPDSEPPRRSTLGLIHRGSIIVDDGVATGSTARAACRVARASGAGKVVLAVPVGPPGLERAFEGLADQVVCLTNPRGFRAVGQVYRDFGQTSDHDVAKILRAALRRE